MGVRVTVSPAATGAVSSSILAAWYQWSAVGMACGDVLYVKDRGSSAAAAAKPSENHVTRACGVPLRARRTDTGGAKERCNVGRDADDDEW